MTNDAPTAESGAPNCVTKDAEAQLLERNGAFCMAPWMHLHVLAEGDVTPCCESRQKLGNINRQTFQESWNGAEMKSVRAQMLRGERIAGCQKCYEKEDSGIESPRTWYNSKWRHLFDTVTGSRTDGHAPNARPLSWDVRFSNICNFRCRSCWHGSSSRWFADGTALGVAAGPQAIIHGVEDADSLFAQVEAFLPHLEEVYFAGGEPLMMEEHYRLLDLLIARGCRDVALRYNTNLSITGYKDQDVLARWNQFPNVRVSASIDAAGARGELVRKEQRWADAVANARRIRSSCPHVIFRTDTTVSVFNALHLPDLFRELIALDFVAPGDIVTHLLQDPLWYNIRVLPKAWKARVRAGLARFESWLEDHLSGSPQSASVLAHHRHQIREIVTYMDSEDWTHLLPKFREKTAQLDALRTESTATVFPELAPLLAGQGETWRHFTRSCKQKLRAVSRRLHG
jgi:radical SAM protein with 4Fe4S-binding SPASM domain